MSPNNRYYIEPPPRGDDVAARISTDDGDINLYLNDMLILYIDRAGVLHRVDYSFSDEEVPVRSTENSVIALDTDVEEN